jgi:hypothetical protein
MKVSACQEKCRPWRVAGGDAGTDDMSNGGDYMKSVAMSLALSGLFLCGCIPAPTDDSDISENWMRIGPYTIGFAGDDGTAKALQRWSGWTIVGENTGGYGKTLVIENPSRSVKLGWAYNVFYLYEVDNLWTGQTARGARIGTSLAEFTVLHPEFVEDYSMDDTTYYKYEQSSALDLSNITVTVAFDSNTDTLIRIRGDGWNHLTPDYDNWGGSTAPWWLILLGGY